MCAAHKEEVAELRKAEAENGASWSADSPSASTLLDLCEDHLTQIEHMWGDNAAALTRKT